MTAALLMAMSLALRGTPLIGPAANAFRLPVPYAAGLGVLLIVIGRLAGRFAEKSDVSRPRLDSAVEPPLARSASSASTPVSPAGPTAETKAPRRPPASTWSDQVFEDIEWRRFEAVCEALFAQAGFEAKSQSHGADGGVDIWLYSRNAQGPAAVVQCKHWRGKKVGVKELREFFGVMTSHGLKRGTFATSSTLTDDARQFAKSNGISALDCSGLLALIAKRNAAQQDDLLRIAYEGEYWRPTCASCGIKMVERTSGKDGSRFWGCENFPRCRSTLAMRAA